MKAGELLTHVELARVEATQKLDPSRRSELGQFLTPLNLGTFMAKLFVTMGPKVRLLDPGAGVGSLVAAFVAEACRRRARPKAIDTVAVEIDRKLTRYLEQNIVRCRREAKRAGIRFTSDVIRADFITTATRWPRATPRFTHAILNPPYKKLSSDSDARRRLRRLGVETSNLYTAFLALAVQALAPGGELVAITPRSFCNGPYFRAFREMLLAETSLTRIHVFESRTAAFAGDEVLQENIVFHAIKGAKQRAVLVSTSAGPEADLIAEREVPFSDIVRPGDPEKFIHVVPDELGQHVAERFHALTATLEDVGTLVSTGKVVDFRAKDFLRAQPGRTTAPLIYPTHFDRGVVRWPKKSKKPNALVVNAKTDALLMPSGVYVVVKRFSSKEERRRVVAAVFDPAVVPCKRVGFENHLNVFHDSGHGLRPHLARGLAAFLNSSLVDIYFRQFSGHTQVNATDLRNLKYPSAVVLERLGKKVGRRRHSQDELDGLVNEVFGRARPVTKRQGGVCTHVAGCAHPTPAQS